ncbi:hypothetical protein USB125703_01721 [Pseudoclavibacter triregionum]|nr:hypothetical protein USB125703_01721 [Pseudoclavibacter triregionum]
MIDLGRILPAVAIMVVGGYALRLIGMQLGGRMRDPARSMRLVDRAVAVLILAVLVATALFDGQELASPARPIGVGAGIVAALCKAPLVVVILVAMGVTALLRLIGIP